MTRDYRTIAPINPSFYPILSSGGKGVRQIFHSEGLYLSKNSTPSLSSRLQNGTSRGLSQESDNEKEVEAILQRVWNFVKTLQSAITHPLQTLPSCGFPLPGSRSGIVEPSRTITLSSGNSTHAFIYTYTHLTIHKSETTAQLLCPLYHLHR
ncbi:hypothetical protein AVEN_253593-1 [Araneus ventricosus]|uniref:Uncharacterized protein n=1 Tax=Araneus ventricosus TaxID=182803 RepID=A0A4Y2CAY5_ARAVE|nr:hypothetical protein AVEN_253593-1 [Araneus ventricosus]